jgi:hypothetical protein
MKYQATIFTLLLGVLIAGFQNCSGTHQANDGGLSSFSSPGGGGGPEAAFYEGFYSFTQSQGCVACHGSTQIPKFAQPDVNAAYAAFQGLVNPTDPGSSIIITYSGNGHCLVAACQSSASPPKVAAFLAAYAAAVTGTPVQPISVAPKYLTPSMPMPTTIPAITVATPAVVRFPLASFGIPSLSNALLEVEIQMVNTTEYRVGRPKIMGNTAVVTVSGIHVFIKPSTQTTGIGTEDPDQGSNWVNLIAAAAISTLPATLPTGPLAATPLTTIANEMQMQSASDMITIGIDKFPVASGNPNASYAYLNTNVFVASCTGCHSGATPAGNIDLTTYLNVTKYLSKGNEAASMIYTAVSGNTPAMPLNGTPLSAALVKDLGDWINDGAANN